MVPNSTSKTPVSLPRTFVRIRNVSESATEKDIENLFPHLAIPDGGISIFGKNAFVKLNRLEDMATALNTPLRCLQGRVAYVSCSNEEELERLKSGHLNRNKWPPTVQERLSWVYDAIDQGKAIRQRYYRQWYGAENDNMSLNGVRRLRPVAVVKKRHYIDNPKFLVQESPDPPIPDSHFKMVADEDRYWKQSRFGAKRIRPTAVSFTENLLPQMVEA